MALCHPRARGRSIDFIIYFVLIITLFLFRSLYQRVIASNNDLHDYQKEIPEMKCHRWTDMILACFLISLPIGVDGQTGQRWSKACQFWIFPYSSITDLGSRYSPTGTNVCCRLQTFKKKRKIRSLTYEFFDTYPKAIGPPSFNPTSERHKGCPASAMTVTRSPYVSVQNECIHGGTLTHKTKKLTFWRPKMRPTLWIEDGDQVRNTCHNLKQRVNNSKG